MSCGSDVPRLTITFHNYTVHSEYPKSGGFRSGVRSSRFRTSIRWRTHNPRKLWDVRSDSRRTFGDYWLLTALHRPQAASCIDGSSFRHRKPGSAAEWNERLTNVRFEDHTAYTLPPLQTGRPAVRFSMQGPLRARTRTESRRLKQDSALKTPVMDGRPAARRGDFRAPAIRASWFRGRFDGSTDTFVSPAPLRPPVAS